MSVCLFSCLIYPDCKAHLFYEAWLQITSFLRSIIPSWMACLVLPFISTISHKRQDFAKKNVLNKNVFWFSLLLLSATSLIPGKIEQDKRN